jgi:drug/metabolite transporter (DMT)-like permease
VAAVPVASDAALLRGHLALVAVQLCFGLFPLLGKWAFAAFAPDAVAAWRIACGAAVLGAIALAVHGRAFLPRRGDLLRLQACALLGIALNQVLFLEGLQRAPSVNAGLMMSLIPVYTFAIAVAVRQERFQRRRALGILVALAGAAQLVWQRGPDLSRPYLVGNLLFAANGLCYSVYLVASKPLAVRYPPLVVIAWVFLLGAWTIPLFAHDALFVPVGAGARAWLALALILVFATVLGYLLNVYALRRLRASTTAVYVFAQPLIAGVAGVVVLGEEIGGGTVLAAACIFVGIGLVSRR